MDKFWRTIRIVGALAACVVAGVLLGNAQRNRAHNVARTYVQVVIEQAIEDAAADAESYAATENGLRVYYVNAAADMAAVKDLLAKCKPVHEDVESKPVDRAVVVGGLDIGYMGGGNGEGMLYRLPVAEELGEAQIFVLPEKYNDPLWALLDALPVR